MAKALGLIGNFKGKLGNTVGYSLKDSNNKQTQGVRVYQPVVRNPKTAAQAEQRCKLAPINATYRALKMVIDRGQEGKAYGNKSRLAWLKDALKAFDGPYFVKGAVCNFPCMVALTKGSLPINFDFDTAETHIIIETAGITVAETTTIGALSTKLRNGFPELQEGDQITFVQVNSTERGMVTYIDSIVIDSASTAVIPSFITVGDGSITLYDDTPQATGAAVIVSREGENGAHLRNNASLVAMPGDADAPDSPAAKQAAIESYMSQGANTDWAEESLM